MFFFNLDFFINKLLQKKIKQGSYYVGGVITLKVWVR